MSVEEHIARLERTVQDLLRDVERLPAHVLYHEPQAGEWPVMSTLAHLSELMPYWAHEAHAVALDDGKNYGRTHDDPVRLGAIAEHGHDTIAEIVPRIRAALEECVATLRAIPAETWGNKGHHPTRGTATVDEIVTRFIVRHAEEHAAQTHATLAALRAAQKA